MGTGLRLIWSCWLFFSSDCLQEHREPLNINPVSLLSAALAGKAWPVTDILDPCGADILPNRDVGLPATRLAGSLYLNLFHGTSK
jgi:hypothetical protein